jgi:acetoin utilization protein AcuB
MKVEQIMSPTLVSVSLDDTLWTVKEMFEHFKFHHLPVVEDSCLLGIISDRDLLKALSPTLGTVAETNRDLAILNKKAHQILTRELITLPQGASVYQAIDIFNQHTISCIPIVNSKNEPVGMLTWRDIFKFIASKRTPKQ